MPLNKETETGRKAIYGSFFRFFSINVNCSIIWYCFIAKFILILLKCLFESIKNGGKSNRVLQD